MGHSFPWPFSLSRTRRNKSAAATSPDPAHRLSQHSSKSGEPHHSLPNPSNTFTSASAPSPAPAVHPEPNQKSTRKSLTYPFTNRRRSDHRKSNKNKNSTQPQPQLQPQPQTQPQPQPQPQPLPQPQQHPPGQRLPSPPHQPLPPEVVPELGYNSILTSGPQFQYPYQLPLQLPHEQALSAHHHNLNFNLNLVDGDDPFNIPLNPPLPSHSSHLYNHQQPNEFPSNYNVQRVAQQQQQFLHANSSDPLTLPKSKPGNFNTLPARSTHPRQRSELHLSPPQHQQSQQVSETLEPNSNLSDRFSQLNNINNHNINQHTIGTSQQRTFTTTAQIQQAEQQLNNISSLPFDIPQQYIDGSSNSNFDQSPYHHPSLLHLIEPSFPNDAPAEPISGSVSPPRSYESLSTQKNVPRNHTAHLSQHQLPVSQPYPTSSTEQFTLNDFHLSPTQQQQLHDSANIQETLCLNQHLPKTSTPTPAYHQQRNGNVNPNPNPQYRTANGSETEPIPVPISVPPPVASSRPTDRQEPQSEIQPKPQTQPQPQSPPIVYSPEAKSQPKHQNRHRRAKPTHNGEPTHEAEDHIFGTQEQQEDKKVRVSDLKRPGEQALVRFIRQTLGANAEQLAVRLMNKTPITSSSRFSYVVHQGTEDSDLDIIRRDLNSGRCFANGMRLLGGGWCNLLLGDRFVPGTANKQVHELIYRRSTCSCIVCLFRARQAELSTEKTTEKSNADGEDKRSAKDSGNNEDALSSRTSAEVLSHLSSTTRTPEHSAMANFVVVYELPLNRHLLSIGGAASSKELEIGSVIRMNHRQSAMLRFTDDAKELFGHLAYTGPINHEEMFRRVTTIGVRYYMYNKGKKDRKVYIQGELIRIPINVGVVKLGTQPMYFSEVGATFCLYRKQIMSIYVGEIVLEGNSMGSFIKTGIRYYIGFGEERGVCPVYPNKTVGRARKLGVNELLLHHHMVEDLEVKCF